MDYDVRELLFRPLTLTEGTLLVRIAREAVTKYLTTSNLAEIRSVPEKLRRERYGVFVSIEKIDVVRGGVWTRVLRGRVGFVTSPYPLAQATALAAIYAAFKDPRYHPLSPEELRNVVFEVTILSPPELLRASRPEDYLSQIKVGFHGVMVERGKGNVGVLLPQVAVEYELTEEKMLCEACLRANLPPDAWRDPSTKVYRFRAQIFYEVEPEGEVIERFVYLNPHVRKLYPVLVRSAMEYLLSQKILTPIVLPPAYQ